MNRRSTSLTPDYFDGMYADDLDPWRFATSDYERDKYAATLASLPRPHYASGLEIGCSIGVFTRQLAGRCDNLIAIDVVASVLDAARKACSDQPHVSFARCVVPGEWPKGRFDLVVISEVAYFLDRTDLARLAERVTGALLPGGDIVLVHWLGETDFPLSGDEAADGLIAQTGFAPLHQSRAEQYRIDVLRARL